MRIVLSILAITAFLTSCSVNTDGDVDINPNDVQYFKDGRTGLCFGIVASRKFGEASSTGIGITCVPCEQASDRDWET